MLKADEGGKMADGRWKMANKRLRDYGTTDL
jgi:hypothetical protein